MKKLVIITTGGTIGSILSPDRVSIEPGGARLIAEITSAAKVLNCSVTVVAPLNKHSEDFTPDDWIVLLHAIQQANDSDADGVVVTHGTDTLAYSVAAAQVFSHLWTKRICFTGAYYAPDHPETDAPANLLAALYFAITGQSNCGIFAIFAGSDANQANIIRGRDLKPLGYDERFFAPAYGEASYHDQFPPSKAGLARMPTTGLPLPTLDAVALDVRKVGFMAIHPGLDATTLIAAASGKDILVLQGYHCGTGPSGDNLLAAISSMLPQTRILIGTVPERYLLTARAELARFDEAYIDRPYESSRQLKDAGAHLYFELQAHFLYVFSVLGLSAGLSVDEVVERLSAFEI